MDNGQLAFAARCYENAYRYDPERPCYRSWFADAARQGGYRPTTPALAGLLASRTGPVARRPAPDLGFPMPSDVAAAMVNTPGGSEASKVGPWHPQPQPSAAKPPNLQPVGAPPSQNQQLGNRTPLKG
jgi:hypothetical protein